MAARFISATAALVWVLGFALMPLSVVAQEWQPELTDQMLRDHDCEVAFYSQVTEREVNGNQVVLAKVHCTDKRSFDAYRDSAIEPFEIHPCEKPDNKAC